MNGSDALPTSDWLASRLIEVGIGIDRIELETVRADIAVSELQLDALRTELVRAELVPSSAVIAP